MASTSGSSDEIIRIAMPCGGQLAHQAVYLGLGANVDAAGRLVQDDDLRPGQQPLGEHHLLLIAARELCHRLFDLAQDDVQALDVLLRSRALVASAAASRSGELRQRSAA